MKNKKRKGAPSLAARVAEVEKLVGDLAAEVKKERLGTWAANTEVRLDRLDGENGRVSAIVRSLERLDYSVADLMGRMNGHVKAEKHAHAVDAPPPTPKPTFTWATRCNMLNDPEMTAQSPIHVRISGAQMTGKSLLGRLLREWLMSNGVKASFPEESGDEGAGRPARVVIRTAGA